MPQCRLFDLVKSSCTALYRRVRKRKECLLGAPQVKRRFVLAHRFLQALDVAIHIAIEQRE